MQDSENLAESEPIHRRKRILSGDDGGDFTIGYFLNRKSAEMDIEREYKKFINADVFVG